MATSEAALQVELVAADRTVWSGPATSVIARTVEGDLGVLRGHAPLLSLLAAGVVEVQGQDETVVAAVDGGFLSVAADRVSILSEHAALASEIDMAEAQSALEEAKQAAANDGDAAAAQHVARFEARIRAAERVS